MLLDRLRIRGKLALLVAIPLLSMVALAVPVVVDRASEARRASDTAAAVEIAGEIGTLVQELQQERVMMLGYLLSGGQLVDRSALSRQSTDITDRISDLRTDLGEDLPLSVQNALTNVQTLNELRNAVLSGQVQADTVSQVLTAFGTLNTALIDSLRLSANVDTGTSAGRQMLALDAVLRTDEGINTGAAMTLLVVVAVERGNEQEIGQAVLQYIANILTLQNTVARFTALATQEQNDLYFLVQDAAAARISEQLVTDLAADPRQALAGESLQTIYPSVASLITLGQFIEKKIVTDIVAEVADRERQALLTAYTVAGVVLLVLLVVVLLSLTVARTVARPLTRLTQSADRVARAAEAELVRIADDETEIARPIRLDPVDVTGQDEIGDLARAFDRVQGTAVRLVERQAASRRNVAQMFGHVGRRTQNLVGRQIALIDRLEHQETEPSRLQHLYRLDHISSRLRRSASSLVVLSGSGGGDGHVAPMPLGDVVRLALGEIEDYTRVDVQVHVDVGVTPGVIGDLVLALAELMENGTAFSPPHTRVTVSAEFIDDGVRISLVDHGIGMPAERMAEENARLTRRERLDLTPTEVLGLFVVGRLARRHDWRIALSPTPGGGVTVDLEISDRLLVTRSPDPVPNAVARVSVLAGPTRALAPVAEPAPAAPAGLGAELSATATPIAPAPIAPVVPAPVAAPAHRAAPPADPREPPVVAASAEPAPQPQLVLADPVFNPDLLSRATQSLEAGQPWDAFATRPGEPIRPVATEETAGSALRQRVPGAQLPQTARSSRPAAEVPPADPAVVRALIEEFEAGVRRAQQQYGTSPAGATSPGAGTTPTGASTPGAGAPRPAQQPAAPVTSQLNRRVPGANLSATTPTVRLNQPSAPSTPADPDEVRDLITQFESGVARALTEVSPEHRHEEGRPQ